jgi:Secretion system C-terminal sorting domain
LNAIQPIANYQAKAALLDSMIENVKMLNNNLLQQTSILTQTNYNQAEIANGGVFTTEIPQVNSQFINEVSLQYEQQGIAAIESYYPSLLVLANQCPYQGGNAVYRARFFVGLLNDSVEYNDDLNCLLAGIWRKPNEQPSTAKEVELIPNPNNGYCALKFSEKLDEKIDILISDINGGEVLRFSTQIQSDSFVLNLSKLANGCYSVKITGDKRLVFNDKLLIVK